ncbi:MAG: hypothetical protein EOO29_11165 [Comamonadaceae bacterium]|nr:MAG: hypothetical protein EOO29_11165 [Comamonadaceae bacterium]
MSTPRWPLQALGVALPLLLLNALLAIGHPGHGPWPQPTARVSLELCAAVALLAAWTAWRGAAPAWLLRALAVVSAALIVIRLVDVMAIGFFGRPLNLYWDGRHLGSVAALSEVPAWQLVAGAAVLMLLIGALALSVGACWRAVAAGLSARGGAGRRLPHGCAAVVAVCAGLVGVRAADGLGGMESWRWFSEPVTPVVVRQARLVAAHWQPGKAAARLPASPAFASNLGALQGADVLVIFSESYGVSTLDDPAQAQALAGPRAALAQAIADSGRAVVSARVRSPTFGGGSWLAHASLLSGIDMRDPFDYDLLLTTQRPTLARHFAAHGYRSVIWAPGLQRPWPEGRFYGFDRYGDARDIGYTGLPFGAWRIPDQAAMALLHAQELSAPHEPGRAPRFVVFPTVNSHAPFYPLPPFVADWSRLTTPDAYTHEQQARALEEVVSWRDPVPAYVQSIALTWQWLAAYLRDLASPNLLVIVIGDHQPWARVSGYSGSWDVPVHVMSANADLLRRFESHGFAPGLLPQGLPLGDMHALTPVLASVFSTE